MVGKVEDKDLLEDLLRLVEEEPEELSLDEMAKRGMIVLIEEPDHSRNVILTFQAKYGVHSFDVTSENYRALQWITEHDLAEWRFAIEQFKKAGGMLEYLPIVRNCWFYAEGARTSPENEGRGSLRLPSAIAVSA